MIVSHQHKLIFLKPRKVAGTSFEIALSKYLSEDDIITPLVRDDEAIREKLGFVGPRNFNYGITKLLLKNPNERARLFGRELPLKFYNHMPATLAKRRLEPSVWRNYRKISLVRNPWERAISLFSFRSSKANSDAADFTSFVRENLDLLESNYANYMVDGEIVIDYFIRYENFEDDIRELERQLPALAGLWEAFKGINAKGNIRDKSQTRQQIFEAHPEVKRYVEQHNSWEIEKFGYQL